MPRQTVPLPGNVTSIDTPLIHSGDQGDAVVTVQQRLQALGFYRGAIDGDYGPQTSQAIANFQQMNQLALTGNVDSSTLRALGFEVDNTSPPAMTGTLNLAQVIKMFPNVPSDNIQSNLPFVLNALAQYGLSDIPMTLMALATIRAETGSFTPLNEFQSKYNTKNVPFDLYDSRSDLGNREKGDGARFKGRGFIQLTGRHNYQVYSQKLGLKTQLLDQPELANQPEIAARILACFLKDKETLIRQALTKGDLVTARKAVNGGTHGMDAFQLAYETGATLTGLA